MFNKNMLFSVLLQVLFGMLGAIIVQCLLVRSTPKVVTVDFTGMVKSFESEIIQQKLDPTELKQNIMRFGQSMNGVFIDYAKKHNYVIVPKEAVIAGAHDDTDSIKILIKKRMNS
jgi:type-F conjugative transfer system protein TrbI